MALGNFGRNLAGALQGQKDYADWEQMHEARAQQIQAFQQAQQREQEAMARQRDIARGALSLFNQQPEPMPPMPGQASVPMTQPVNAPPSSVQQGIIPPMVPQQGSQKVPLGLRQNNPGNLRKWGNLPTQNGYAVFPTPEAGLSAMENQLKLYGQRGINTIGKIISTWAPSSENNTNAYISAVSNKLGIDPNTPIDVNNPAVVKPLMQAMVMQEQGNQAGGAFIQNMLSKRSTQAGPQVGPQAGPQSGPQVPPYAPMRGTPSVDSERDIIGSPPKYDWNSAIKKLSSQGITDPQTVLAVLDRQQSRLDTEAKNTLAYLKEQELNKFRVESAEERSRHNRAVEQLGGVNADIRKQAALPSTGMLDPAAIDLAANQMLLTGQLPPMGMGKQAAAQRAQVLNRAAELANTGGFSAQDLQQNKAELKAGTSTLNKLTQFGGMIKQFEATANKNADLAMSLAKGAAGTDYPTINSWINAVQKGRGKGDIVAFQNALETFKLEYAKIMSGATGAAGITEGARKHADDLLSVNMSKDQLQAAISTAKAEMANRMSAIEEETKTAKDMIRNVGKRSDKTEKSSEPKRIASDSDYQNLPSGSEFIAPDGSHRRKP